MIMNYYLKDKVRLKSVKFVVLTMKRRFAFVRIFQMKNLCCMDIQKKKLMN